MSKKQIENPEGAFELPPDVSDVDDFIWNLVDPAGTPSSRPVSTDLFPFLHTSVPTDSLYPAKGAPPIGAVALDVVNGTAWFRAQSDWVPMGGGSGGGGATILGQLLDVTLTTPAPDEALVYNGSVWENQTIPRLLGELGDTSTAGATDGLALVYRSGGWGPEVIVQPSDLPNVLNDLANVNATPVAEQFLKWNGSSWIEGDAPVQPGDLRTTLQSLDDTVIGASVPNGYVLTRNGFDWIPAPASATGAFTLDELTDVSSSGAALNEVLGWNGSLWVPQAVALDLDGLTDVDTTGLVVDDVLTWNGSLWVPQAPPTLDLSGSILSDMLDVVYTPSPQADYILVRSGTAWVPAVLNFDRLADVDITSTPPTTDESTLRWDGTNWVPYKLPASIGDLDDVDVTTAAPTANQVLSWDDVDGEWKPANPTAGSVTALEDIGDVAPYAGDAQSNAVVTGDVQQWDNAQLRWIPVHMPNNISELGDVEVPLSPNDGEYLVYSAGDFHWKAQLPSIDDMSDVDLTGVGNNKVLIWQTDKFAPSDFPSHALNDLSNVNTAPTDGQHLYWNQGNGQWEAEDPPVPGSGGATELDGLSDVTLTTPGNGEALIFNGSEWVNSGIPDPALGDLTDVNTAGVSPGDRLVWDGAQWQPDPDTIHALDDLSDVDLTGASTNQILTKTNGTWTPAAAPVLPADLPTALADLTDDVDTTTAPPVGGQVLEFQTLTSKWEPATPLAPSEINLDELADVTAPSPTTGDHLEWNGSAWTPAATKYADDTAFTADTPATVTHNLNTTDVIVQVWDTGSLVTATVVTNGVNAVDITVTITKTLRVVVMG